MTSSDYKSSYDNLNNLIQKNDWDGANDEICNLLIFLVECPALPPTNEETGTAIADRTFACNILEKAAMISLYLDDTLQFQSYFAQLRPYYNKEVEVSEFTHKDLLVGLHLLILLVDNQLGEFHSELEIINEEDKRNNQFVSFSVELEHHMMAGNYGSVLTSQSSLPHELYAPLMESMVDTARESLADCISVAYDQLSIDGALEMLCLDSKQMLNEFVEENELDWKFIDNNMIKMRASEVVQDESSLIPSLKLISENLSYATELERIV